MTTDQIVARLKLIAELQNNLYLEEKEMISLLPQNLDTVKLLVSIGMRSAACLMYTKINNTSPTVAIAAIRGIEVDLTI